MTERLAYDPWGKRRFIATTPGLPDDLDTLVGQQTDRGYTEHEHLDEIGVIHMNGRVYDPLVGRFMSADPHVTYPLNLQSFNRYAYVLNNPLRYTDPSGFDAWSHEDSDGRSTYNPSTNGGGLGGISPGSSLSGNAANAFVCSCWFAVPSLQSILTGIPDAVLGIGAPGMWGVNPNASLTDLGAAGRAFSSPYATFNHQLLSGLMGAANDIISRPIQLAAADGFSLGGQSSDIRGWKAVENAVVETYRNAGYTVEQGVRVVLRGMPGELDRIGVADFIARKEGELLIGEVKDGLGAKFTQFQKAVAGGDASALGRLAIVNDSRALRLNLKAGEMLSKQLTVGSRLELALFASAGSRAARQAGEYWGAEALGTRVFLGALRVVGGTFVTLMTMEANAGQ